MHFASAVCCCVCSPHSVRTARAPYAITVRDAAGQGINSDGITGEVAGWMAGSGVLVSGYRYSRPS